MLNRMPNIPCNAKHSYDTMYCLVPSPASNPMLNYTQVITYDGLGNIQAMQSQGRWTRNYIYDTTSNRLLRHEGTTDVYTYDAHGNMTAMPHL